MPKNLGVNTFPDPIGHFGAPWRPFWIFQAVRHCRQWASAPFTARLVLYYVVRMVTLSPEAYYLQGTLSWRNIVSGPSCLWDILSPGAECLWGGLSHGGLLRHIVLGQVVSGQVALGHQWIKVLLKEDKCHQANIDRTNISWQSDTMTVVTYIVIETYFKVWSN